MAEEKVYLAYAVPVDPVRLAASLNAFIETKVTLTAFRLCAQYGDRSSAPLGRLPPELLLWIEDLVRDSTFERELLKWQEAFACLTGDCMPEDHITEAEMDVVMKNASDAWEAQDVETDDCLAGGAFDDFMVDYMYTEYDDWRPTHWDRMLQTRNRITREHSRLSKYRARFAQETGIKIHFDLRQQYFDDTDGAFLENAKVAAFLMLPLQEFTIQEAAGPLEAHYSLLAKVNLRALQPLSTHQRTWFDKALRILRLTIASNHLTQHLPCPSARDEHSEKSPASTADVSANGIPLEQKGESEGEESENEEWPTLMLLGSGSLDAGHDG